MLLLLIPVQGTHIAARQMQDVNVSGSLRFRSLWLYGATHQVPAEDWRPMWGQMNAIRRRLRVTYPHAVAGTDASWNAASAQLTRTGHLDWVTANALCAASNTMTFSIEHRAQREAVGAGQLMLLGLVGVALIIGKSLLLARRTEQAEDNLRRAEQEYHAIYENAVEGILQATPQGRFLTANPAMARILGYDSPQQLIDEMTDIGGQLYADPADRARYIQIMQQEGRAVAFEARLRRRDGTVIWASMNARAVRDETGELLYFEGTVEDVTAQREAAEILKDYSIVLQFQKAELEKANMELETLATTDGLTGLCNHRTFQQKLAENCQSARRYGSPLSLLMLDVDCFKQYNDTFGHPAGDGVLRQVAALLRETTRTTDIAARYGGEEFAVILPHTDAVEAAIIAERVRAAVAGGDWPRRPITVSVGITTLRQEMASPASLVAAADTALYASKQGGRNRVMAESTLADLSLLPAA